MGVISVRLDDHDEQWLRENGHRPGAFARAAVHEAIRLAEIRKASEFLAKNRIEFGFDSTAMIREDRDSR